MRSALQGCGTCCIEDVFPLPRPMNALVSEGGVPPASCGKGFGGATARGGSEEPVRRPVWLGKDYQLNHQPGEADGSRKEKLRRGFWRALSLLEGPLVAPLEWVEPALGGGKSGG